MMLTIIFAGLSNLEGAAEFAKHLTTQASRPHQVGRKITKEQFQ